ncbi:hypothetical protein SD37_08025 [Amycolatopsis orientalis]|uniref:Uncharacterized protein n=1 Tax=Amycolatopsis orientalis TaxID=31958 RepID=A0A193BTS2_AMYOR|nr:hypothetical protein [Amycolatopsis orientalis]ANN15612.1 hypothetical protein SD37_08025 [Amycolatopsis orientalis]
MTLSLEEPRTAPRWRYFARHAIEMAVAMFVGMELFAPLWPEAPGTEVAALAAATDMTVAMTVWMLYRGHGRARVLEMAAAMYVPYLLLLVPHWSGLIPGEDVLMGGHALMLPAMAIAMLIHRQEYSLPHGDHRAHPLVDVLGHRAPTWIALAMTMSAWSDPAAPLSWVMLILPAAYLFFGVIRGSFRDRRLLAIQVAGFAFYFALAVVAANADPEFARWVIAAAWGSHAVWDFAHHRADAVAPRWWSEWCGVVDLVVAVTIVVFW